VEAVYSTAFRRRPTIIDKAKSFHDKQQLTGANSLMAGCKVLNKPQLKAISK